MTTRLEYYRHLNDALSELCTKVVTQHPNHSEESNNELLELFAQLDDCFVSNDDYALFGQQIINRIVSHYPDITPQVHRDLLWFFGGDCLHFLGDEEIQKYQELEERYYELNKADENVSYRNLRAQVFNMH
ncbi:PA2817 family protein [Zhongshania aliphaticivorans]|uniref:PA2817 family protein n=1 Tax=Zhongshania aliphaticivorans TaxID=1470434 RepID=UPI0012E6A6C1|nr:PA2817 family protein [Zhongshania aliphaticivorans]CAA0078600.1 Uncharacterised protein [Zhongshania aliphaticivorans]